MLDEAFSRSSQLRAYLTRKPLTAPENAGFKRSSQAEAVRRLRDGRAWQTPCTSLSIGNTHPGSTARCLLEEGGGRCDW
jgi:hypothetical protein